MKNKILAAIALLTLSVSVVYAQLPPQGQILMTYGDKGNIPLVGTADQVIAMDHTGFSAEAKTVQGSDATVAVTGSAGLLSLTGKLAVNASASTGTVSAARHSMVVLTGSGPTVALPDAASMPGDMIVIVNLHASAALTAVTTVSSQLINGASASSFAVAHSTSTILLSTGTGFVSVPQLAS